MFVYFFLHQEKTIVSNVKQTFAYHVLQNPNHLITLMPCPFTREYFYSVIFEISDKQMQFAGLKNTPKQKKNWYFDNFDKSKSRNSASGSWFGQKYVN